MFRHPLVEIIDGRVYDDGWATRRVVFSIGPLQTEVRFVLSGWSPDFSILIFDSEVSLSTNTHIEKRRVGLGESFDLDIKLAGSSSLEVIFESERALLPDEMDQRERSIIISSLKIFEIDGKTIEV